MRIAALMLVALGGLGILGCTPRIPASSSDVEKPATASSDRRENDKHTEELAADAPKTTRTNRRSWHDSDEDWLPPLRTPGATEITGHAPAPWARGIPFTESQAIERIERELADALRVRPTVVVWLFDQSAAAGTVRRAVASAAIQMPSRLADRVRSRGVPAATAMIATTHHSPPTTHQLSTAIVAFGSKVNVLTPQPIAAAEDLPQPQAIREESAAATQTYAAVSKAAELFAPYRLRGNEVIFVLVAHSAVAGEADFTAAVATLNKAAIPVFGIGPAAPFGRLTDALSADLKPVGLTIDRESRHSERIKLYFPGNEGDAQLTDSGYGPYHLERLCRATKGHFLRLLPNGSPGWATQDDGDVVPALLRRYAPDYVSEDEYQRILAGNRACRALHEAAQLPPARVLVPPRYDFRKQEEDAMNRELSLAQRASAENQTALERLHQTLVAGEPDRPQLTGPRWQAAFDLAYGRACAARARNDGYNQMLALLKIGKTFANAESTTWSLKPAEGIAGRSDLDTIAKKAKTYLERVVREHPGTPWAAMAARELQTPCGWEWKER
ncbi:MAG: hypothetical protein WD894_11290 [Pirellulales bacterium]